MHRVLAFGFLVFCAAPVFAMDPKTDAAHERASDGEMTQIFNADQAARKSQAIDWSIVSQDDQVRRARTQVLLDEGRLNSAEDFYHAAFVFQHGDLPEDFLKAHALAVVAAARGKPEAAWIAAATLDRYLQRIGRPQIYGTQYQLRGAQGWTQEPYRRDLLSDALRDATGVPSISGQEERLEELKRRAR